MKAQAEIENVLHEFSFVKVPACATSYITVNDLGAQDLLPAFTDRVSL